MTPKALLTSSAEELIGKMINSQAQKLMPEQIVDVVNRHCKLAAGAGLVPVPGADMAMGTANTLKMFQGINHALNISSRGINLKAVITTMLTQFASRFTVTGVTNILKFIPGAGQATGALVSSVMQYLLTLTSGYVYFNALSLLVDSKGHISLDKLGEAINATMADKEKIDVMLDAIKSNSTQLFTTIKDNVSSWAGSAADGISSASKTIAKGTAELYDSTSECVISVADSVAEGASSLYDSASQGVVSAAGAVAEAAETVGKSISDRTSQAFSIGKKGLSTFGKSVKGIFK